MNNPAGQPVPPSASAVSIDLLGDNSVSIPTSTSAETSVSHSAPRHHDGEDDDQESDQEPLVEHGGVAAITSAASLSVPVRSVTRRRRTTRNEMHASSMPMDVSGGGAGAYAPLYMSPHHEYARYGDPRKEHNGTCACTLTSAKCGNLVRWSTFVSLLVMSVVITVLISLTFKDMVSTMDAAGSVSNELNTRKAKIGRSLDDMLYTANHTMRNVNQTIEKVSKFVGMDTNTSFLDDMRTQAGRLKDKMSNVADALEGTDIRQIVDNAQDVTTNMKQVGDVLRDLADHIKKKGAISITLNLGEDEAASATGTDLVPLRVQQQHPALPACPRGKC